MNKETLTALKGSIEKWKDIRFNEGKDDGTENCPLCKLYYTEWDDDKLCVGCPVSEKTGEDSCSSTPYTDWKQHHVAAHNNYQYPFSCLCSTCREIAADEIKFLESLLPGEGNAMYEPWKDATPTEKKYFAALNAAQKRRDRKECEEHTRLLNEIQEDQKRRYTEWLQIVFESIYWGNDEENEEFSVTTYHIYPVLENPNATLMLRSELSVVRERHVEEVNDLLRKYLIEPEEV